MTKRSYHPLLLAACLLGLGAGNACAQQAGTPIEVPGLLKFEAFKAIGGNAVQGLLDDQKYIDNKPDETLWMTSFDTRTVYPTDAVENYGGRITGFVTPAQSGDYEFFLRSDDGSQLLLSPDDKPAGLLLEAEETGCCAAFLETGDPRTTLPKALVAGKKYAIQVLYKEGGGGDYAQVAWRKVGDTTPAANLTPIPGAYLSSLIPAGGSITITKQPANATAAINDPVTLSLEATGTATPLVVQWRKNGTALPGVTGQTIKIGRLAASDAGTYSAVLSIPGAVLTSGDATLTLTPDVTLPTLVNAAGSDTFDTVTVTFSEPVTAASAEVAGNYGIAGLTVSKAVRSAAPNEHVVVLTTSKQTSGTEYTLTVKDVLDTAATPNRIAAGTSAKFSAFGRARGGLKFEAFLDIAGTPVQGLLDSEKFINNQPDIVGYVTQFTSRLVFADASHENYGGRISGWIVPTETAQYEFFIRSDDASQLSLSPDDKPENAVVIANENGCCGPFEAPGAGDNGDGTFPTSAPQSLTAGKAYYIAALWKEGGGGDYCDVAWRKVGDPAAPSSLPYISGAVLETIASPTTFVAPQVAFSAPAEGTTFDTGVPVNLTVSATAAAGKTITKVEFFENAKVIATVTSSPYTLTLTGLSEDPHKFTARATDSAGIFTDTAALTVTIGKPVEEIFLLKIDDQTTWSYDRSGADLGTEWREKAYNDSQWKTGKALIADETTTTVEPIRTPISRFNDAGEYVQTFFFRGRFNFNRLVNPFVRLQLRHVVDDGAIFYLNGKEIHRFGVTDDPVTHLSNAAGHENAYEGPIDLPLDSLVQGENVLAVEVHQSGGSSSDMVFGAELKAIIPLVQKQLEVVKIDDKTTWRYDRSGADLGTAWREKAYNDSQWPQGKALIADETTTTVEPIRTAISRLNDNSEYVQTFYFRTLFNLPIGSTAGAKLKLRHVVDDGAVFYLNGKEIHRLGLTDDPVTYLSSAAGHENIYEGPFDIPITDLLPGDNVLAVEVHQSGGSSSDMVFGAELVASVLVQKTEEVASGPTVAALADGPLGDVDTVTNIAVDTATKTITADLPSTGKPAFLTITPAVTVTSSAVAGGKLTIKYQ